MLVDRGKLEERRVLRLRAFRAALRQQALREDAEAPSTMRNKDLAAATSKARAYKDGRQIGALRTVSEEGSVSKSAGEKEETEAE